MVALDTCLGVPSERDLSQESVNDVEADYIHDAVFFKARALVELTPLRSKYFYFHHKTTG